MMHAIHILERSGTSFNAPEPLILKTMLFVGAMLYGLQLIVNLVKLVTGYDNVKPASIVEN
jgi:hypothetical protein